MSGAEIPLRRGCRSTGDLFHVEEPIDRQVRAASGRQVPGAPEEGDHHQQPELVWDLARQHRRLAANNHNNDQRNAHHEPSITSALLKHTFGSSLYSSI